MKRFAVNFLLFFYSIFLWIRLGFEIQQLKGSTTKIFYGGMAPEKDQITSGGKVKLLTLIKKFGPESSTANILYWVTSALPFGVLTMTKIAKSKGLKVVVNQNGVGFPAWIQEPELSRLNLKNKKLLEMADFVIYQSQFCKESVKKWVGDVNKPFEVIYNPISTNSIQSQKKEPSKNCRLLVLGSHRHPERIMAVLETLSLLKNENVPVQLYLAGLLAWDGCEKQIQEFLDKNNLQSHVIRVGPYLQKDLPHILSQADILIHLQDKDASPTVPLEALAAGIPVIAPQSGGLTELIAHGVGALLAVDEDWSRFVIPAPSLIAQKVKELWPVTPEMSQKCSQRAKEQFDEQIWIDQHVKIFNRLLQST